MTTPPTREYRTACTRLSAGTNHCIDDVFVVPAYVGHYAYDVGVSPSSFLFIRQAVDYRRPEALSHVIGSTLREFARVHATSKNVNFTDSVESVNDTIYLNKPPQQVHCYCLFRKDSKYKASTNELAICGLVKHRSR
ncbi:MAG: hypothetical protein KatS3mg038_2144 [Candidatus Kapaibacterium sp.]|nr:MAG: hypothetical protein KatS3mg038_2144 [Candidatus Kapabacteria bacterium]